MDRSFLEKARSGCYCPTCGRWAKIYRRRLNAGICLNLIKFYEVAGTIAVDRPIAMPMANDVTLTTAKHWGLIVRRADLDRHRDPHVQKGRRRESTVMWQLTPLGIAFVRGEARVNTYAIVYDNQCLRVSGPRRSIRHHLSLGGFDYEELMSNV